MTALSDVLFPRTCLACGRTLRAREEQLCIWCAADLPLTMFWQRLHNPMADRLAALIQNEIQERDGAHEPYAAASALFFYNRQSGYRFITRSLKYHANLRGGRGFARRLGDCLAQSPDFAGTDLVLPVPLHWTRYWSRGYNQAEVIAREVASRLGSKLETRLLKRSRRTRTQTGLSGSSKADNVSGAFRVRLSRLRKLLSGLAGRDAGEKADCRMKILLVDDVCTSGATLCACHRALRDALEAAGLPAGAVRINFATLGFVGGY